MALGTTKVDGSRRLCLEPGEMASADAVCGKGPADRVRGRCKRLARAWHVQGSKGSWYTASSWAVVGHALHNGLPRPVHGLGRRVASDAPLGLAHMSSHTRICKLQFDTEPARATFRLADCACRVASGRRRRPPACLLLRVLGVVCCGLGSLAQAGPYSRLRLSVVKQSASGLTIWTELPGVRSEHGGYHGLPVWVQYNSQGRHDSLMPLRLSKENCLPRWQVKCMRRIGHGRQRRNPVPSHLVSAGGLPPRHGSTRTPMSHTPWSCSPATVPN